MRNPHRQRALALEVAGVITLKLAALTLIYFAFFAAPPAKPDLGAQLFAASSR